ncbi:MAG: deoxyribonuclease IV [Euryarchaeota archaeon]|nr:deoxyribonuclease IV [Euryarchaeota archaeon]
MTTEKDSKNRREENSERLTVGCHVSIAGSIDKSVDRAVKRGCDTFQMFTRNPRGWKLKPLDDAVVAAFAKKLRLSGISPVIDHMPYLPNLASPKSEVYEKSIDALATELLRCRILGIPYLVTHLGSHLGEGKEEGLKRLICGINTIFEDLNDMDRPDADQTDNAGKAYEAGKADEPDREERDVMLLLENTAGIKNSVGGSFEDIGRIIKGIHEDYRVGICLDTCHAFAAGYELRTETGLSETVQQFQDNIGIDRLKIVHLNDSKGELGSHLDRHEHIGLGKIGEEGMIRILNRPEFRKLPLILETPVDERRDDPGNIIKVRELAEMSVP